MIERDLKLRKAADLIADSGVAIDKAESAEDEGTAEKEEKKPAPKKTAAKKPAEEAKEE